MKVRPTSQQIVCEYCGATSILNKNPWQVEYINRQFKFFQNLFHNDERHALQVSRVIAIVAKHTQACDGS